MTSSGTPKAQLPENCRVSRTSSAGDVTHCSVPQSDLTRAHRALKLAIATRSGAHPSPNWRPRNPWRQQIGDGTSFSIHAEGQGLRDVATDIGCLRDLVIW